MKTDTAANIKKILFSALLLALTACTACQNQSQNIQPSENYYGALMTMTLDDFTQSLNELYQQSLPEQQTAGSETVPALIGDTDSWNNIGEQEDENKITYISYRTNLGGQDAVGCNLNIDKETGCVRDAIIYCWDFRLTDSNSEYFKNYSQLLLRVCYPDLDAAGAAALYDSLAGNIFYVGEAQTLTYQYSAHIRSLYSVSTQGLHAIFCEPIAEQFKENSTANGAIYNEF